MPTLKQSATDRLITRYRKVCTDFPLTREYVTQDQYVAQNLFYAMRNLQEGK